MVESIDSLVARIEDSKARIQESQNSLSGLRGNGSSIREGMAGRGEGQVGGNRLDVKDFYFNVETDVRGTRISFGATSFRGGELFPEIDTLTFEVKRGLWEDANGNTRGGLVANARGIRTKLDLANGFDLPEENVLAVELGLGTATAEASAGNDGFSFGATAVAAEVAITEGTSSAEIDTDETIRRGLSYGVGAAVRGHWGDADSDGFREYGFGGDYAFFSLDAKTEDPLRAVLSGGINGSLSGGINGSLISDAVLPEVNLTESVANLFGLSIKDENASNA
ncbi:hypothetical protein H6G00_26550 [Leptolyngbya sp. FACHB-541]|uniref:hypothetical protein n=1 Tax=Leptolyngbya sp. FACHB-541 TaxID=2692810 RepID=UPI00168A2263|nr:hypothetical protein [Leptolyngbya sp. FACHB-541]MBD2000128.1 hypothetical protein [Leptolyngbya sp. FACHB-541]